MQAAEGRSGLPKYAIACVLGVAYASLLPFDFRSVPSVTTAFGLLDLRLAGASADDVRTNVLVYIPVGLIAAFLVRGRGSKLVTFVFATVCGTLLSITLECLQTCLASRVGSWTDVALNACGALLGGIGVACCGNFARVAIAQARRELREHPMCLTASLLTLGLFLYSVWPFDFVTTTDELHASFSRAKWSLVVQSRAPSEAPLAAPAAQISGALWFAGLGYVLALAALEARRPPLVALVSAMKNGALLAALIEGMQLFTGSHVFDLGAIFLRVVAVVLGGWSAVFLAERDPRFAWPREGKALAPTSVLMFLAVIQVALLVIPTVAAEFRVGPFDADDVLPLERLRRVPAAAAIGKMSAVVVTYGVLAWTLAVIARRGGVGARGPAVGLVVTLVALGQTTFGILCLERGADPATPVLALLSAFLAVGLDRAVHALWLEEIGSPAFHADS